VADESERGAGHVPACDDWTARDLLAHVAAGGDELHRLVASALAGEAVPEIRAFANREAPFAAMPDPDLRDGLAADGLRLLVALAELHSRDPNATIALTGADLTATQLMTHVRSELVLHRWDLIGDNDLGTSLLAQPDLLVHGRWVLKHMPSLAEARRRDDGAHNDLLALWGRRR